jgi:hypothetical protein
MHSDHDSNEMEKPRIAFLLGAPYTSQNRNRIGVPYLDQDFELLVLDCCALLGRPTNHVSEMMISDSFYVKVSSFSELRRLLICFKPQVAIDFIGVSNLLFKVARVLNRIETILFVEKTGPRPLFREVYETEAEIDISEAKPLTFYQRLFLLHRYYLNKIYQKIDYEFTKFRVMNLKSFGAIVAGDATGDYVTSRANPLLRIASNDYHTFSQALTEESNFSRQFANEEFILFIDDCVAEASDWILLGLTPPVDPESYFSEMRLFFDRAEEFFSLPVVIAGHPNAEKDPSYSEKFGGRKVYFGQTARLAIDCELALTHFSTAISFAVLANKRIISLTSKALKRTQYGRDIEGLSRILGTPLLSVSENLTTSSFAVNLNIELYKDYTSNYLFGKYCEETEPWGELKKYLRGLNRQNSI